MLRSGEGTIRRQRWGLYEPQTEHDACGIGFVAHIHGEPSRDIVVDALTLLERLSHRGACGADPETGDGAGILVGLPDRFFRGLALGTTLPRCGRYAVGQVFFPPDPDQRAACEAVLAEVIAEEGQVLLDWRDVPVDPSSIGRVARGVMPFVRQVFVGRRRVVPSAFEQKLFVIRKLAENRIRERGLDPDGFFHVCSLSSETIVYKGLLLPKQLTAFYDDLRHPAFSSAIALVHGRFSTNTFPTWDLAQPFRWTCHNGEINTLRGNRNWMTARRALLQSAKFGGTLDRLFPIIDAAGSDSAQFDNMLELLHLGGRSLPHAMMMMIPEAFEQHRSMHPERRAFYDYASALMEPWDGPAAIAFTDGQVIGATLDRNGLRPARWLLTDDDRVVLASEVGCLDIPPARIRKKGRLRPGRMLIVDTSEGTILDDAEVKADICARFPYRKWLDRNELRFADLPVGPTLARVEGAELARLQRAFGWTDETVRHVLEPMARTGKEAIGSMGDDTPLAVLSDRSPSLFRYFKQLFAQVTNPPIDPIREELVMSLRTSIGGGANTFEETPEQCHRITIDQPVLRNDELGTLSCLEEGVFESVVLSMVYDRDDDDLQTAVDRLCDQAVEAVDQGHNLLVLSDREVDARRVPIPALLAVSAVHQRLVREGTRMLCGLVVESGEVTEVHHFALLLGYGAGAVNPWLALDALASKGLDADAYIGAIGKGLRKVMSKMGISTLESYCGSQIFECVGLDRGLVDQHFTGTPSRIEGIGLAELDREARTRHQRGFEGRRRLPVGGEFQWRPDGERHAWSPEAIAALQRAVRSDDAEAWRTYAMAMEDLPALRNLYAIDVDAEPVPLEEVEPWQDIASRFVTGAMSFGSLGAKAHETLALAMNEIGGRSNSGEGGEEAQRFHDLRRSAIKQVASGRFGVHASYLVNADELQIKIAQGAKPGEGGQLPGHKVTERIARVRCSTPGVTLISPPPHHDIYSIEDLAQLIYDLHTINPASRVSVKLVSEVGVGTVAAGVAKAGAGCVVVAGASGGTGASPLSSVKHAGLPWELGLAETQQVLMDNGLRDRIRVQVDGGFRTGRDVVVAALLGAEEFGFSTAPLVSMGCVMLRKCHLNTCSVGIATQDEQLQDEFTGDPEHVVNFFRFVAEDVRLWLSRLGARSLDEIVGRCERLKQRQTDHWKISRVDLSPLLEVAEGGGSRRCVAIQPPDRSGHLDHRLRDSLRLPIHNTDRAVGALLSGKIAREHGQKGLPEDTIRVRFDGSAGQSFGAFLARGVTFSLFGDANDYFGKGLSGGRLIVRPPTDARYAPEDNVIIGNTVLYGATSGEVFVNGMAGERFAVRNSGARAVVEGVGDHGCEYMTGGVVVVLGRTGRNFAAGMSGGMAFVFDRDGSLSERCNRGMVELEPLVDESDIWLVMGLVEAHVEATGSPLGQRILDNWEIVVERFVKVMPTEYRRVLQQRRARRRKQAKRAFLEAAVG